MPFQPEPGFLEALPHLCQHVNLTGGDSDSRAVLCALIGLMVSSDSAVRIGFSQSIRFLLMERSWNSEQSCLNEVSEFGLINDHFFSYTMEVLSFGLTLFVVVRFLCLYINIYIYLYISGPYFLFFQLRVCLSGVNIKLHLDQPALQHVVNRISSSSGLLSRIIALHILNSTNAAKVGLI